MAEIAVPEHVEPVYSKGYTIKEAAAALECSSPHLLRMLKGERDFTPEMRRRLKHLPQKTLNVRIS